MSEPYTRSTIGVSQWFNIDGSPVDAETKRKLDADYKTLMERQMQSLAADIEEQVKRG